MSQNKFFTYCETKTEWSPVQPSTGDSFQMNANSVLFKFDSKSATELISKAADGDLQLYLDYLNRLKRVIEKELLSRV